MTPERTEREAFEKAWNGSIYSVHGILGPEPSMATHNERVAWSAWQMRAALSAPRREGATGEAGEKRIVESRVIELSDADKAALVVPPIPSRETGGAKAEPTFLGWLDGEIVPGFTRRDAFVSRTVMSSATLETVFHLAAEAWEAGVKSSSPPSEAARAEELERCAKVCDELGLDRPIPSKDGHEQGEEFGARACAAAIRSLAPPRRRRVEVRDGQT